MRATRWIKSAVTITVVVALGAHGLAAAPASSVYPPYRATVTFSHTSHAQRGATCLVCHPGAVASLSAVDNLLPTERECRGCHLIERAAQPAPAPGCVTCHPGFRSEVPAAASTASRVPSGWNAPAPLKFAHARHRATACTTCHVGIEVEQAPAASHLPTMASCLGCHAGGTAARACTQCHLADAGGQMRVVSPLGVIVPFTDSVPGAGDAHGPAFALDHGRAARRVDRRCGACHDDGYCADCHQGSIRDARIHDPDYLAVHGLDARRNPTTCASCHRTASFCIGCHERSGVGTRAETAFPAGGPAAFHPDGWASPGAGPNLHAVAARRRITTCASCHRETDCVTCHTAEPGAPNASPHPRGWRGSSRCRAMDRTNRRLCLRCHVDPAQLGCDWSAGDPD